MPATRSTASSRRLMASSSSSPATSTTAVCRPTPPCGRLFRSPAASSKRDPMKRLLLVFSALLGSVACNGNGAGDGGHDGGLLNICNDAGSALADKACELDVTVLDGGPGGDAGLNC